MARTRHPSPTAWKNIGEASLTVIVFSESKGPSGHRIGSHMLTKTAKCDFARISVCPAKYPAVRSMPSHSCLSAVEHNADFRPLAPFHGFWMILDQPPHDEGPGFSTIQGYGVQVLHGKVPGCGLPFGMGCFKGVSPENGMRLRTHLKHWAGQNLEGNTCASRPDLQFHF